MSETASRTIVRSTFRSTRPSPLEQPRSPGKHACRGRRGAGASWSRTPARSSCPALSMRNSRSKRSPACNPSLRCRRSSPGCTAGFWQPCVPRLRGLRRIPSAGVGERAARSLTCRTRIGRLNRTRSMARFRLFTAQGVGRTGQPYPPCRAGTRQQCNPGPESDRIRSLWIPHGCVRRACSTMSAHRESGACWTSRRSMPTWHSRIRERPDAGHARDLVPARLGRTVLAIDLVSPGPVPATRTQDDFTR